MMNGAEVMVELRHLRVGEVFEDPELDDTPEMKLGIRLRSPSACERTGRIYACFLPSCSLVFYEGEAVVRLVRLMGEGIAGLIYEVHA